MKKVLVPVLAFLVAVLVCGASAWADGVTYVDPSNLHVGPGAGTSCATGCAGDPNSIGSGGFDVYYNTNGNGNLPIGTPFYLIVATAIYSGSNNSPTVGGTATMYSPYSTYPGGGTSVSVTATGNTYLFNASSTAADIYDAIGITITQTNNSFSYVNMASCDTGVAVMGTQCPNSGFRGSGAPLAGVNVTGFDLTTWAIGTSNFGPGDLLDFTSALPVGSFVAAVGVNGTKAWDVPFTEAGLVTQTPEPGSFVLLGAGLLALAAISGRRFLTA